VKPYATKKSLIDRFYARNMPSVRRNVELLKKDLWRVVGAHREAKGRVVSLEMGDGENVEIKAWRNRERCW
jgi:hypothetical protein